MNVHEFAELAAGYALNALSPKDAEAFQAALAEHPEWASIFDTDAATVADLATGVPEVEPPAHIRSALLAAIAGSSPAETLRTSPREEAPPSGEQALTMDPAQDAVPLPSAESPPSAEPVQDAVPPQSTEVVASGEPSPDAAPPRGAEAARSAERAQDALPPQSAEAAPTAEPAQDAEGSRSAEPPPNTDTIQTVARRTWTRGLLALAASFVLLIALGTAAVTLGDRLRAPASVAALEQIQAAEDAEAATAVVAGGGTATAYWSVSLGQAVVVTTGVEAASRGETYELWFVRDGAAVSAGQFDTDASGSATAEMDGTLEEGDVIAVTVEPEGGSPTGQPSSDPIVAVPTA